MNEPAQLTLVMDESKKATACPDCGKFMQYASIRRHRLEACKATDIEYKNENRDGIKSDPLFRPFRGIRFMTENSLGEIDEWNAVQKFDEFTRNIARPDTYKLIGEMRELLMKVCAVLQDTGRQ